MTSNSYPSSRGVEQALRDAARRAHRLGPTVSVQERIRQEVFRRMLSRVFRDATGSWLLKGGTGMLSRVPDARATLDIDLVRSGYTLEQSLAELKRVAEIDLADHFRFEYRSHSKILAGDQQSYTKGLRVIFDAYLGAKNYGLVKIDLVSGSIVTGEIAQQHPAGALELPRLQSFPFRLYPVVDQIADKVCATLATYASGPSTREKDLIDLVVFAETQAISSDALSRALAVELSRRQLLDFTAFRAPEGWGLAYAKLARTVSACANYQSVGAAMELMSHFIDPVLRSEVNGKTWNPSTHEWQV